MGCPADLNMIYTQDHKKKTSLKFKFFDNNGKIILSESANDLQLKASYIQ